MRCGCFRRHDAFSMNGTELLETISEALEYSLRVFPHLIISTAVAVYGHPIDWRDDEKLVTGQPKDVTFALQSGVAAVAVLCVVLKTYEPSLFDIPPSCGSVGYLRFAIDSELSQAFGISQGPRQS